MPILIHKIIQRIEQTDSLLQIPYVTSVRRWNEEKKKKHSARGDAFFS